MYTYPYPRPAVTADTALFHHTSEGDYRLLLIERGHDPFKGCWALPGGFLDMDETLPQCALRELEEETAIRLKGKEEDLHFQEIGAYSAVDRDPRGRTITVAYMAVIEGGGQPQAVGGDDAAHAQWFPIDALPLLAFDHQDIIQKAISKLKTD